MNHGIAVTEGIERCFAPCPQVKAMPGTRQMLRHRPPHQSQANKSNLQSKLPPLIRPMIPALASCNRLLDQGQQMLRQLQLAREGEGLGGG